jgi:hypothetical protein
MGIKRPLPFFAAVSCTTVLMRPLPSRIMHKHSVADRISGAARKDERVWTSAAASIIACIQAMPKYQKHSNMYT